MLSCRESNPDKVADAVARLVILVGLFIWMFRPELSVIASSAAHASDWVHTLIIPVMIALLVYLRRAALVDKLSGGSLWGILLLTVGLALYAAATWPFNYGYIRDVAMIPVLAGIVLVVSGWGALRLCFPMLLLAMLAIPIGPRIYARLIIRPETYTIQAVATVLGALPGVDAVVRGVDVFFESDFGSGVVALAESNRGVRLLPALAALGVFVTFSRIRSLGRLVFVACTAIPIILFCNFFRLFCWAVLDVYVVDSPTSPLPRNASTILSLLLAYLLFACVSAARLNLFADAGQDAPGGEAADE
ncbi:MAG: exosortase/archaeosortase family protein [Sedimentisphaerales bacterium]|nr:exosortase/archaeosortase family protein [Sedimentisphaerales bacterium]